MQFWGDALVHFQCLYPALLDALFVSRTPAFGCIPSWLFLEPNPGVADAFLENTAADDTTHGIARNAIFRHGRVPATVTAIVPRLYEYVTTRGIRSEERRVGKECRGRCDGKWWSDNKT